MTVYGYARVSTDRQAEEGESLGTQERTIRGYAMVLGHDNIPLFIERGVSGSIAIAERPEGAKLMAALRPGDVIIVPKFDRIFRNARDALNTLHTLTEQKITLHIVDMGGDVTGTGTARLIFMVLAAVAENVRHGICENVRAVKRDQRQRGRYLGGAVPFGWRVDSEGALIEDIEQQAQLRRAKLLKQQGQSLRNIAARLKQDGCDVSHNTLARVLRAA